MKKHTETLAGRTFPKKFIRKLRNRINVDAVSANDLRFKIAEKKVELEAACRLVHDRYIRKGYMSPTESGLRLCLRYALPETTTFIGKKQQRIAFTLTLFQDSELGLPMDAIYKKELDSLRRQGRKIAEVGSLATHATISKNDHTLLMHGNKIMGSYSRDYLGVDDLVIAINPRHQWFYEHVLLFEQIGGLKAYDYVKKAPALAFRLNFRTAFKRYKAIYGNQPDEKNLHRFFYTDKSACIELPKERHSVCFWNVERIKYFFEEKTHLLAEANSDALECLQRQYHWGIGPQEHFAHEACLQPTGENCQMPGQLNFLPAV